MFCHDPDVYPKIMLDDFPKCTRRCRRIEAKRDDLRCYCGNAKIRLDQQIQRAYDARCRRLFDKYMRW